MMRVNETEQSVVSDALSSDLLFVRFSWFTAFQMPVIVWVLGSLMFFFALHF